MLLIGLSRVDAERLQKCGKFKHGERLRDVTSGPNLPLFQILFVEILSCVVFSFSKNLFIRISKLKILKDKPEAEILEISKVVMLKQHNLFC